jgi:hypothetical protein
VAGGSRRHGNKRGLELFDELAVRVVTCNLMVHTSRLKPAVAISLQHR